MIKYLYRTTLSNSNREYVGVNKCTVVYENKDYYVVRAQSGSVPQVVPKGRIYSIFNIVNAIARNLIEGSYSTVVYSEENPMSIDLKEEVNKANPKAKIVKAIESNKAEITRLTENLERCKKTLESNEQKLIEVEKNLELVVQYTSDETRVLDGEIEND